MFKNYIKVAYRNLKKRLGFTAINIGGLAIGIACCLLIAVYVFYEGSYDEFHENGDRIYRVTQKTVTSSKTEEGATTPFPVAPALQNDYPDQIAKTVRFFDMQEEVRTIINKQTDEAFRVNHFYVVDSTFFDVFSADLLMGDPDEVLDSPMSAVITESQAKRFFGDENPVGKQLTFKGVADFTVTGVMKELPDNSHMQIEMLVSFNSLKKLYGTDSFLKGWYWNPCWTYVMLDENASADRLQADFGNFVQKNYTGREDGEEISLTLQPLEDIHLYSNLDQEMEANGSIFYVYLFSVIAVLILIIACINFTNLSTARSQERSQEVGIRKVLGANRSQLFFQFISESFWMTLAGFLLALVITSLALPLIADFTGKELQFSMLISGNMIWFLIALFVAIVLLSGIYPALYLSGFNPIENLHGSRSSVGGSAFLRKSLVVFQFSLSVMLVIGTIVVYLQLRHMQNKDMGFNKEQVVVMPITQTLIAWEFEEFKEKALANPSVQSVSGSSKILASEAQYFGKYSPANQPDAPPTNMVLHVTHDFLDTYEINLLAGRSFSRDYSKDADRSVLINESMLKQIGVETPEDAIGKTFEFTDAESNKTDYNVIGVVDDFYYTSVKKEISPVVIDLIEGVRPTVQNIEFASVRLAPNGIQQGLDHIRSVWKDVNHIDPFTYFFLDKRLQRIYASERKMGNVAGIFSVLCIFVACLGLLGLASFTASLRTKEIGIRKALGATVTSIVSLLSKDYLKLVLLANIIAWPVSYYLAMQWLQEFPSRIELGWNIGFIFLAVAITSGLVGLITVSSQSLRAAMINPVDSIRRE